MRIELIFAILCLFICQANAVQLQSEIELRVKKESATDFNLIKAGEILELNRGETVLAVPSTGLPFFILVPSSQNAKFQLAAGDVSSMAQNQVAEVVGKTVHEVIIGLRKAETFMSKREYTQGLSVLMPLKQKYPQVAEIFFLSASLNYLNKNKNAALDDVQKGLAIFPEDESAKKLLANLQTGAL